MACEGITCKGASAVGTGTLDAGRLGNGWRLRNGRAIFFPKRFKRSMTVETIVSWFVSLVTMVGCRETTHEYERGKLACITHVCVNGGFSLTMREQGKRLWSVCGQFCGLPTSQAMA